MVVVVAVAAALAVVLTGVLSPGAGSSVSLVSEHAAVATAADFTNGIPGGPWQLTFAEGYLGGGPINSTWILPRASSCQILNRSVTTIANPFSNETAYGGLAEVWVFAYANSGGSTGLTVVVQNGAATELGQWSGPDCRPGPPLGTDLIDSTSAAEAVTATKVGADFIANYSEPGGHYTLENDSYLDGGVEKNASFWGVVFGLNGDTFSFGALVFANNGTVYCTSFSGSGCTGYLGPEQ